MRKEGSVRKMRNMWNIAKRLGCGCRGTQDGSGGGGMLQPQSAASVLSGGNLAIWPGETGRIIIARIACWYETIRAVLILVLLLPFFEVFLRTKSHRWYIRGWNRGCLSLQQPNSNCQPRPKMARSMGKVALWYGSANSQLKLRFCMLALCVLLFYFQI
jgi:hypothetical protein